MGLKIASFLTTSREVPKKWSLAVFLKGCNFKCKHCYNWRLVTDSEGTEVSEEEIINEIKTLPFLECVVISGGEPTVSSLKSLVDFVCSIKEVRPDIKVRIDTNGSNPEILKELKKVVDGFAVDIKAPLEKPELYSYTVGADVDVEKVKESVSLADGMPLTIYRTPKFPWLKENDIALIERFTKRLKSPWFLNEFFEVPNCPFNAL